MLPLIKLQYASPPTALPIFNFRQYKGTDNNWDRQINFIIFINMSITIEEFKNNFEFKITKKALMREFPFILDVGVKDYESINRWKFTSYIELVINPYIISNMYGFPIREWVTTSLKNGKPFQSSYLTLFFNKDYHGEVDDLQREIQKITLATHRSPAIPPEMKLGKEMDADSFVAYPDSLPRHI